METEKKSSTVPLEDSDIVSKRRKQEDAKTETETDLKETPTAAPGQEGEEAVQVAPGHDPNPHPPPLVEEILEFKKNCCLRMTLWHEKLRRRMGGPPPYAMDYILEEGEEFGVRSYSYIECQGYRPYMEDRHIAQKMCSNSCGFYAVLDGHGLEGEGHIVADYASRHLGGIVDKHLTERSGSAVHEERMRDKFDHAFTEIDNRLRRLLPIASENNGSTVTAALVEKDWITFANLGDSRAALVNEDYSIDFVTLDHKPTIPSEERRVLLAGGFIDDARVNGDLAVSRTIGDSTYKPQNAARRLCPISNEPDVTAIRRTREHHCVLLASDGLWDALSTKEVVGQLKKFEVFKAVANGKDVKQKLDAAFKSILLQATRMRLSSDNLTLFLVFLLPVVSAKQDRGEPNNVPDTATDTRDEKEIKLDVNAENEPTPVPVYDGETSEPKQPKECLAIELT